MGQSYTPLDGFLEVEELFLLALLTDERRRDNKKIQFA
jgi:hypothetical protein